MFKLFVFLTVPVILLEAFEDNVIFEKSPIDERIVGGHNGDIKDYPYMLSLTYDDTHVCGAGLIAEKWALTAVHCLDGFEAEDLTVRSNTSALGAGQLTQVARLILHPNYDDTTQDSDIALLELSAPVSCVNCKSIPLGTKTPTPETNATISGWGITVPFLDNEYSYHSHILQVAQVPVVDHEICRKAYLSQNGTVTENMFCAGFFETGGVDACIGDSGGPVVVDGGLVGIVSWGHGCARAGYPGVYTLVTNYLDWIRNNTGIVL